MIHRRFASASLLSLLAVACSQPPRSQPETPHPAGAAEPAPSSAATPAMNLYDLKTQSLEGTAVDLGSYRGKVTLVVNVASQCGYTPQYSGLQKLHSELQGRGFAVLGFPSNDFGAQEPGTPSQIREFCTTKYAVDFPLFAKVQTKSGPGQSPIYATLASTGHLPNWNFCKYLIGKDGKVLGFFPSKVTPDSKELRAAIEAALQ